MESKTRKEYRMETTLNFVVFVKHGFPEQMQLMIIQTLRKQSFRKKKITAFILPTETKLKTKLLSAKPHFKNAQMRLTKKNDDRHFNTINLNDLPKHVSETLFEVIKRKIVNITSRLMPFLEKNEVIKKSIETFHIKTIELK